MSALELAPDEFWRVAGHALSLANDYLGELDSLPTFPPNRCCRFSRNSQHRRH